MVLEDFFAPSFFTHPPKFLPVHNSFYSCKWRVDRSLHKTMTCTLPGIEWNFKTTWNNRKRTVLWLVSSASYTNIGQWRPLFYILLSSLITKSYCVILAIGGCAHPLQWLLSNVCVWLYPICPVKGLVSRRLCLQCTKPFVAVLLTIAKLRLSKQ